MLSNSHIKKIRSLHSKKFRKQHGQFIVEGEKVVAELLNSDFSVVSVYSTMPMDSAELITQKELEKISVLKSPNKIVAIAETQSFDSVHGTSAILLDGVNDPGNLGAIIRIADWFGVSQLICSSNVADCYNPKVVQSAMGSLFRVKVVYTDLIEYVSVSKIPTYCAVMDGESPSAAQGPFNLVLGSESHGIRSELLDLSQHKITIPGKGETESLNVSVAAGILLDRLVYR